MSKKYFSIGALPGSLLMWLILINELVVFAGLIIAARIFKYRESGLFTVSLTHVSQTSLLEATLVLLIGGFFAAEFIRAYKMKQNRYGLLTLLAAIASGCYFIIHKYQDLSLLASQGFDFAKDDFWLYYWSIMSFHFVHVIIAVGMLIYLLFCFINSELKSKKDLHFFESGVLFWHLCDLIWIMIFPLYYWRFL